jgi:hypothetical protein
VRNSMTEPSDKVEEDRALLNGFLKGERTFDTEPWLLQEDVLFLAAQRLARRDPDWVLSQLARREFAAALRETVARNAFVRDLERALEIIAQNME